jgi:hypothetical protein
VWRISLSFLLMPLQYHYWLFQPKKKTWRNKEIQGTQKGNYSSPILVDSSSSF